MPKGEILRAYKNEKGHHSFCQGGAEKLRMWALEILMTYTLYGSYTSPFVRRLRMLLENIPHNFSELSVFDPEGAAKLSKINPINQVPVLTDGDQVVWDSRQIFNYLNSIHKIQKMNWNDENSLTAIEGAILAGVNLFMLRRSGVNTQEDIMFINRQKERIESVLNYLKPFIEKEALNTWNFHTMTLYSLLDWGTFREIFSIDHRPECKKFLEIHSHREIVKQTAIPKG